MKTVFNMKITMIMKNYNKYICAFVLLLGMNVNAWGVDITTDDFNFGSADASEDFEDCSTSAVTTGNGEATTTLTSMSDYGIFTHCYIGKTSACNFSIQSAASPMTSKYLQLVTNTNTEEVAFTRSFTSTGAFTFKIAKSSKAYVGLYQEAPNNNAISGTQTSVYLHFTGSAIQIHSGSAWVDAMTILPSTDILEIAVIYNNTTSNTTYGNDIPLSAKRAHIYVNGTAIMNSGDPKEFTIPGRSLTYFRVGYGGSATTIKIDDINIYDALPTGSYSVTYDGNGKDGGGAVPTDANSPYDPNSTVTVLGNVNSMTRTGYSFNGWNTLANGTGTPYAAGATFTITENTTLFAQWSLNSHTLAVASVDNVAISSTTPSVAEGASTSRNYGTTVTLSHGDPDGGRQWGGWNVYKTDDASTTVSVDGNNQFTMPDYNVTVSANLYADFRFSCAELTLTPKQVTAKTPIFITSTANKMVRSQDSILVHGSGLTPNAQVVFTAGSKFEVKSYKYDTIRVAANGTIDRYIYIFYTPDAGDTSDGLDQLIGISASVGGAKPKGDTLKYDIIGRHLPTDFVIAGKVGNKWYALPSNMASTTNPKPSEIAVDDINNPTIAYTATSNIYGLDGPTTSGAGNNITSGNGQYVRLTMSIDDGTGDPHAAPLFGSATGTRTIGKSGNSQASSHLSAGWWWLLTQKNTSVTNPQDAKYTIKCANNTSTLSLRDNAGNPDWGLFASGVEELRLIPASDVEYTESDVVAWGQKKLILEIEKPTLATQARAKIGDGSWSTNKSMASTTGTSVKGTATKYNYTLDFTSDGFDFAANEGKMLIVELLNNEGTALRATSVLVPRIIAADRTINKTNDALKTPWNTEVHVLPGVTLTVDASTYAPSLAETITLKELNIYPGATVDVESGTLIATTLILRNGWNRLTGEKSYDVARLYLKPDAGSLQKTNAYSDWYIDYDQYYPIAVPFPVATSNIIYKNSNSSASAGVKLRYYSGELRATNIQQNQAANWVEYTWGGTMPANLEPSHGYIMTAKRPTGKAFSIVRMPLTFSNEWTAWGEQGSIEVDEVTTHKDQVAVRAWDKGSTPSYAKGWNIIANPYMSLHQGALSYNDASGDVIEYANIPDIDFKEYDQLPIATTKLKPSSAFLVQAPKDGTVTFGTASRKASAPSYRRDVLAETLPTQRAYIVLANNEAEDMMGILVSDKYSAEYELNADLEKLMSEGKSLRTYMHWGEMNMAYLAINKELAQQWIPVSVRIETEGEHTFSMHSASIVGELKAVYLTDYQTGMLTNLLEDSYSFYSTAGTIHDRFAINAVVGPRDLPTELDVVYDGNEGTGPIKFIYHDKVFILHEGVIYDLTGKKVSGK